MFTRMLILVLVFTCAIVFEFGVYIAFTNNSLSLQKEVLYLFVDFSRYVHAHVHECMHLYVRVCTYVHIHF